MGNITTIHELIEYDSEGVKEDLNNPYTEELIIFQGETDVIIRQILCREGESEENIYLLERKDDLEKFLSWINLNNLKKISIYNLCINLNASINLLNLMSKNSKLKNFILNEIEFEPQIFIHFEQFVECLVNTKNLEFLQITRSNLPVESVKLLVENINMITNLNHLDLDNDVSDRQLIDLITSCKTHPSLAHLSLPDITIFTCNYYEILVDLVSNNKNIILLDLEFASEFSEENKMRLAHIEDIVKNNYEKANDIANQIVEYHCLRLCYRDTRLYESYKECKAALKYLLRTQNKFSASRVESILTYFENISSNREEQEGVRELFSDATDRMPSLDTNPKKNGTCR